MLPSLRFRVPLLALVLASGAAHAVDFYSIDLTSDPGQLVRIDSDTGAVKVVGTVAFSTASVALASVGDRLFTVSRTKVRLTGGNLEEIDPIDASRVTMAPLSLMGSNSFNAEGLTALPGGLLQISVDVDDDTYSETVADLSSTPVDGVMTNPVVYTDALPNSPDLDRVGADASGVVYGVDTSPGIQVSFYQLDPMSQIANLLGTPLNANPAMQPSYTAVGLAPLNNTLWAMDRTSNRLLRVSLGGVVQGTTPIQAPGSYQGLAMLPNVPPPGCSTLIDFESLAASGGAEVDQGTTYTEDGFVLDTPGPPLFTYQSGHSFYSGSTALHSPALNSCVDYVRLRAVDGSPFNLCSIDITESDNTTPKPFLNLTGQKPGGPVWSSHYADGVRFLPQSVSPVVMSGVTEVLFQSSGTQWDNLCICDSPITCVDVPSGAVAWWAADSCLPRDRIGAHHGTVVNGPPPGTTPCGGDPTPYLGAGELTFGGANGTYVVVPKSSKLEPRTGDASLVLWVRIGAIQSGVRRLIDKPGAYSVYLDGGVVTVEGCPGGSCASVASSAPPLLPGTWHFVATTLTRSPTSSFTLYVDDFTDTVPVGSGSVQSASAIFFGASGLDPSTEIFDGQLDEIQFYDRALAPPELFAIRNAGAAGLCKGPNFAQLDGFALASGEVSVRVAGTDVTVATSPGATPTDLAAALTDQILASSPLRDAQVTAVRVGNRVSVANAPIEFVSSTDPGIEILKNGIAGHPVPVVGGLGGLLLTGLLGGVGLRRARAAQRANPSKQIVRTRSSFEA